MYQKQNHGFHQKDRVSYAIVARGVSTHVEAEDSTAHSIAVQPEGRISQAGLGIMGVLEFLQSTHCLSSGRVLDL